MVGVASGRRTEEERVSNKWRIVMQGRRVGMKERSGSDFEEEDSCEVADSIALFGEEGVSG